MAADHFIVDYVMRSACGMRMHTQCAGQIASIAVAVHFPTRSSRF